MNKVLPLLLLFLYTQSWAQVNAKWEILENKFENPEFHRAKLTLSNTGSSDLDAGWKLYFNSVFISVNTQVQTEPFQIRHLQGDFFVLEGKNSSPVFKRGEEISITYQSRGPYLKNSYAPEGLIFQNADGTHFEIKEYQVEAISLDQFREMAASTPLPIPTAARIYSQNEGLSLLPKEQLPPFLPTPKSWKYTGETLKIKNAGLAVVGIPEFEEASKFLLLAIKQGYKPTVNRAEAPIQIRIVKSSELPVEGYKISIAKRLVFISASSPKGAMYGVQSFLAMMPADFSIRITDEFILPQVEIEDYPAYSYRGFFLDVARNFQPKSQILKLLDLMSIYKLNVFHFNLANDEGWRLQIPGLPELTEFGSKRGFSEDESDFLWPYYASGADPKKSQAGSGFYTVSDFQEILAYAKGFQIEVIPEFGVPAHSRAAILAMESRYSKLLKAGKTSEALQYRLAEDDDQSKYLSAQNFRGNTVCVCQESTYAFYEKLVLEVKAMYQNTGVELKNWHTGGDEVPSGVWTASPTCKDFLAKNPDIKLEDLNDYFRSRAASILKKNGLEMGGWEEIGQTHSGNSVVPNTKFADQNWRLYAWNAVAGWGGEDMAYRLANAGYPVVICSSANFYFDLAYDWDPNERGHTWSGVTDMYQAWKTVPGKLYLSHDQTIEGKEWSWASVQASFTKLSLEGKKNIIGVSGQLWTETVKSPEMLEYYLFPKMLGYIERAWVGDPAWSNAESEEEMKTKRLEEWNIFANLIGQKEIPRLEKLRGGFNHRIPKSGVMIKDGMIYANVQTPGLVIRYTQDGSEPIESSAIYSNPIPHKGGEKFRVFTPSGNAGASIILD
ncbi:MAG: family 20 glycosylhydrolase [Algoriphagus sp.]|uniref:family 20 glycosylhydrolase n=1 Tax=Algoriphagus sp. TaxID=1872435 RepID=UPI0027300A45|nr:family 20 glycosylhydrolase [Algoriphagus sp.]MDP2039645.1 family 20 glycosylhydrolase [Algoriphagus sp.]MDP3470619.1 family 20 glycosylhydrolase [Algoriphagus sp.]